MFSNNITIPLGTYGLELAEIVRGKFNEQRNKESERSPLRLRARIAFRGRGKRNLYMKHKGAEGIPDSYEKITSWGGQQDVPLSHAQRVALYLIIDISKNIKSEVEWQKKHGVNNEIL
jgi:hypothetical protein